MSDHEDLLEDNTTPKTRKRLRRISKEALLKEENDEILDGSEEEGKKGKKGKKRKNGKVDETTKKRKNVDLKKMKEEGKIEEDETEGGTKSETEIKSEKKGENEEEKESHNEDEKSGDEKENEMLKNEDEKEGEKESDNEIKNEDEKVDVEVEGENESEKEKEEKESEKEESEKEESESEEVKSSTSSSSSEEVTKKPVKKRSTKEAKKRTKRSKRPSIEDTYKEPEEDIYSPTLQEYAKQAERAGLPAYEMTPEERSFFPHYAISYQYRYLDLRNMILFKWKKDVSTCLTLEKAKEGIKDELHSEVENLWDYLTRRGYINVGLFENWQAKSHPFPKSEQPHVLIIGAGTAGLICAQQLHQFGYKTTILEARNRIGGRCFTNEEFGSCVDLGASIITGLMGNPLDNLTQQLQVELHPIGSCATMKTTTGEVVDKQLDEKMDALFNDLLEKVAKFKEPKASVDKSLGKEMERLRPPLENVESGVLDWYYANLEYACATDLTALSMNHWDQDDPYNFSGEHTMLKEGYASIIKPLANGLDIKLEHVVKKLQYDSKGVIVECVGGKVFKGDVAVVTIPLGVLKSESIHFEPPLPLWKKEAIGSLGFGLLNKVAILFDKVFWDEDTDWFGKVIVDNNRDNRGLYYLWWNYFKVVQKPILVALVAGKAGHALERRPEESIISEATTLLKSMFQLDQLPTVSKYIVTKWKSDPFAEGSYSYVALGATGEDYDQLAKTIQVNGKNKLFFAGEHTCRFYPATVAGAYASGLREAEKVHRSFCTPQPSMFRSPRISLEDQDRERTRKRMVKKERTHKGKSRVKAKQRGVRRIDETKPLGSGNKKYTFQYSFPFSKSTKSEKKFP